MFKFLTLSVFILVSLFVNAEDKPFAVENKDGSVAITEQNEGLRTVITVVADKPNTDEKNCKIEVLKAAIKNLQTQIDLLSKDSSAAVTIEKDHELVQSDIHYTKDGTAYLILPPGADPNDPKFWMHGNKPFCQDCWKLAEPVVTCTTRR